MTTHVPTKADDEVVECLTQRQSFSMVAGAGSGKTRSLVQALKWLRDNEGAHMLRDGQKVVCITYTNRAAAVISDRLRQSPLFVVSTLHSFLWSEVRHFQPSIRESLRRCVIPGHIAKQKEEDNGGTSKAATEARAKAAEFERALSELDSVSGFRYGDDTPYSNFFRGEIGHDDLIALAADMIQTSYALRRVLGQKYPYIFVDEAQDTFPEVVAAFNALCSGEGLPIVGYFGDPMQQIFDKRMGSFAGPEGSRVITKVENFRSAPEVVDLLNAFRDDVTQVAAGSNAELTGSVGMTLVRAEPPEAPRKRYSEAQLERAGQRLRDAIESWGWAQNSEAKQLFLVRQMIARRLGFLALHMLFTGQYASTRAQNAYEEGNHYLLRPLVETIVPLIRAHRNHDAREVMRVLTSKTVAFCPTGTHAEKSIREVRGIANEVTAAVADLYESKTLGEVFRYCREQDLIRSTERLCNQLDRPPRDEAYDESMHAEEKSEWLADAFFGMRGIDVESYCDFLDDNTPYSTQHGVKGEEYDDVIVVFDDVEAAWHNYNFAKILTPDVAGEPGESQEDRSRKLAYVCLSRAVKNVRILLFTPDPESTKVELVDKGLFKEEQIQILV